MSLSGGNTRIMVIMVDTSLREDGFTSGMSPGTGAGNG